MTQIFHKLEVPFPLEGGSISLGFFDGVHVGHQFLLQHLSTYKQDKKSALITFSNHPHSFFSSKKTALLTSLTQKLQLLTQIQIDYIFLFPFDASFAKQSFSTFLQQVHTVFPFEHLVLGKNAAFGKNREGSEKTVPSFCKMLSAEAHYIDLCQKNNFTVSSSQIRHWIQQGDLAQAQTYLSRPYSIWLDSWVSLQNQTAQLQAANTCLPPPGSYFCQKNGFPLKILPHAIIEIAPFPSNLSLPLEVFPQKT